jgi:hypothetical protein
MGQHLEEAAAEEMTIFFKLNWKFWILYRASGSQLDQPITGIKAANKTNLSYYDGI